MMEDVFYVICSNAITKNDMMEDVFYIDCRSRGCSMTTYKRLDLLFSKRGVKPDQIEAFLIRCLYSDKLNLRS